MERRLDLYGTENNVWPDHFWSWRPCDKCGTGGSRPCAPPHGVSSPSSLPLSCHSWRRHKCHLHSWQSSIPGFPQGLVRKWSLRRKSFLSLIETSWRRQNKRPCHAKPKSTIGHPDITRALFVYYKHMFRFRITSRFSNTGKSEQKVWRFEVRKSWNWRNNSRQLIQVLSMEKSNYFFSFFVRTSLLLD